MLTDYSEERGYLWKRFSCVMLSLFASTFEFGGLENQFSNSLIIHQV